MNIKHVTVGAIAPLLLALTTACTTGSPPKQELSITQSSIRSAEAAGAVAYASKPLREAQQKMAIAQNLIDKKKYDKAKHQLQLAIADAELAEASAEAKKSELAQAELDQSIDLMKKEIIRAQGQ